MAERVIVDGNNLLHAMHEHAPVAPVGRETLIQILDRWARSQTGGVRMLVVFDGAPPKGDLIKQMSTSRVDVRFSAPQTADDIIAEILASAKQPRELRVISSDTALRKEASRRHCAHTDCVPFIAELFPQYGRGSPHSLAGNSSAGKSHQPKADTEDSDKPSDAEPSRTDDWLQWMGLDEDNPGESPPHGIR